MPPLTSADVLMYAAYGRLQAIGRDPYEITPAEVFRGQFDPVLRWTERPWQDTPSVYGPIASWLQLLANKLGGENMHDIVFWLQLFALVPFVVAGGLIILMAHGDRERQARAALMGICNPLLIWAVVAGAHNEAISVMFAVAGLLFMRRNAFVAGLGIGLAGCSKVSIGIWGLAMLWAYRREPKKALLLCLGTAIPMGWAYVFWQPTAFFQALRNGGYVSVGSWAAPFYTLFAQFMTSTHAKVVVGIISYLGLFVIGWMLSRVVPWIAAPGPAQGRGRAARPADHRAADLAGHLGGLARHLDVHAVLVRPHRLDAAGRHGREQARPADDRARGGALAGLRPRPRDRRRARARRHRAPHPRHPLPDGADPGADRPRAVVEEATAPRAVPAPGGRRAPAGQRLQTARARTTAVPARDVTRPAPRGRPRTAAAK